MGYVYRDHRILAVACATFLRFGRVSRAGALTVSYPQNSKRSERDHVVLRNFCMVHSLIPYDLQSTLLEGGGIECFISGGLL